MQGVGAAFLLANSAAIITDAFPTNQRGMALGINNIVGVSGKFIGLVLGGLLAPINWRLVFLDLGAVRSVRHRLGVPQAPGDRDAARRRIDWGGNITFALGLVLVMVAITYGIRPYGAPRPAGRARAC